MIGTAPLRPTQERKLSSRRRKRNGHTEAQTAIGRATRISTSGDQQTLPGHRQQATGEAEQPQHHEQHDLPQPGDGVVEGEDAAAEHDRAAAEHDAGDVDGQKAAAPSTAAAPKATSAKASARRG